MFMCVRRIDFASFAIFLLESGSIHIVVFFVFHLLLDKLFRANTVPKM